MNKEQADRCVELAELAINDGDYDKALRLLAKCKRLVPEHSRADAYINICNAKMNKSSPSESSKVYEKSDDVRPRDDSSTAPSPSPSTPSTPTFTQEQLDAVKKILDCKDFYDILGVGKNSELDEIKKAYKKLAFQFHPDKNKAPRSDEAFKSTCLSSSSMMA